MLSPFPGIGYRARCPILLFVLCCALLLCPAAGLFCLAAGLSFARLVYLC
ncbi:MAG: hypothetical protein K6U11_12655 [bacterium]|nr:hypothetical protein [bacterium]